MDGMTDEIMVEIIKNENLHKIYKAIKILDSVDEEYPVMMPQIGLERVLLESLGYVEDFETHQLRRVRPQNADGFAKK